MGDLVGVGIADRKTEKQNSKGMFPQDGGCFTNVTSAISGHGHPARRLDGNRQAARVRGGKVVCHSQESFDLGQPGAGEDQRGRNNDRE